MSTQSVKIAVEQIASTADPAQNLHIVLEAVRRGAATGARVVLLPEASLVRFGVDPAPHAEELDGPWATRIAELARELGVVVVVGLFRPSPAGKVKNTILVTGDGIHDGYDKIHLYDGYGFSEAAQVDPGDTPFVFDVDGVRLGIAVCYDIRFPELFRALADLGASAVLVPTHWGAGEGKLDAWQLLVRARALDSTMWVVACDQADASTAGIVEPDGPRFGIGHSMIVTPMGHVVEELGADEAETTFTVDTATVEQARKVMPVLANRRLGVPVPA